MTNTTVTDEELAEIIQTAMGHLNDMMERARRRGLVVKADAHVIVGGKPAHIPVVTVDVLRRLA